jgi:hypothetical protein
MKRNTIESKDAIITQYKKLCENLINNASWFKDTNGHYCFKNNENHLTTHLTSLLTYYPEGAKNLLDTPLNGGKRLIHYVVILSTTTTKNHTISAIMNSFWKLLLDNSLDNEGNTPLMDAFQDGIVTDFILNCIYTVKRTRYNIEVILLLLHHAANPLLSNKNQEYPKIYIDALNLEQDFERVRDVRKIETRRACVETMYIELIKKKCNEYVQK